MEVAESEAADAGTLAPAAPQWVIFVCSGKCWAVPLDRIREILTPRPFTRLPGAGAPTAGLVAVRSRIVTAFDLGVLLGLAPAVPAPDHRILLAEEGARVTGLVVDEVLAAAVLEDRAGTTGDAPELEWGVSTWEGRGVRLLDLDRVLRRAWNE